MPPFDRLSAKNKWPRGKAEVLPGCFGIQPDTFDGLDVAHSLFRNDVVGVRSRQKWPDSFEPPELLCGDWIWT